MSGNGLHVLAGLDGSGESRAALASAVRLFRASISHVTLAVALDYDGDLRNVPQSEEDRARAILADAAPLVVDALGVEPAQVVLVGRPADALCRYARDHECDLVVVGPRGHGASRWFFGSVASQLARGAGVPVAILPATAAVGVQQVS